VSAWKDTIETLLRERGPAVFGHEYVLTGDPNAAEDLLHDAVIRTFKRGRGTYGVDQAHIYVKRAIFTTFVDGRRRAAARPQASSRSVEVSTDPTAAVDASMAVHEAIL